MAYQIEYAYICHIGKVRGNNEDNFWCCGDTLPAVNQGSGEIRQGFSDCKKMPALAVFDGMGGESCGEMAAFLASEEFGKYYEKNKGELKKNPEHFIEECCKSMNGVVAGYGKENRISSLGTTMASLLFTPFEIFACNLGDSRIYLWEQEKFQQISMDHVLGKYAFGKAPLTQYLGVQEEQQMLEPAISELEYKAGSRYLICSDGMTDMLTDSEIADIFSREGSPGETLEVLLDRVLKKGARDNVTMVLCEVKTAEYKDKMKKWLNGFRKENKGDVQ